MSPPSVGPQRGGAQQPLGTADSIPGTGLPATRGSVLKLQSTGLRSDSVTSAISLSRFAALAAFLSAWPSVWRLAPMICASRRRCSCVTSVQLPPGYWISSRTGRLRRSWRACSVTKGCPPVRRYAGNGPSLTDAAVARSHHPVLVTRTVPSRVAIWGGKTGGADRGRARMPRPCSTAALARWECGQLPRPDATSRCWAGPAACPRGVLQDGR
jgi:hypothetical protein